MKIAVYCGSREGTNQEFKKQGKLLGNLIAIKGHELVYGGGSIGMMGIIADAVLENKGLVTGVMPRDLFNKERCHFGVTTVIETNGMHERKMKMFELSDEFVVMPGGIGTLDEFFEILTWKDIGIHKKRIVVVNIENYFSLMLQQIDTMKKYGFMSESNNFDVVDSVESIFKD